MSPDRPESSGGGQRPSPDQSAWADGDRQEHDRERSGEPDDDQNQETEEHRREDRLSYASDYGDRRERLVREGSETRTDTNMWKRVRRKRQRSELQNRLLQAGG